MVPARLDAPELSRGYALNGAAGHDATRPQPILSVIVPTRNERENVQLLVKRLERVLPEAAEIIFVDDSMDGTPDAVRRSAESARRTVALVHRGAQDRGDGLAGAVMCGLAVARGHWACVMDSDLQHPPAMVPLLLGEATRSDVDVVVASRYTAEGAATGLSGIRRALSRGSSTLARLLFPRRLRSVSDPMSGFFLVRRDAVDPNLKPRGFKILLEILVSARLNRVSEVGYQFGVRHAGKSKASVREAVRYLRQLIRLRIGARALRFTRFALVGGTGIAVNSALLFFLAEGAHVYYLLAAGIATQVSIASNYLLSELWVFSDSKPQRGRLSRLFAFFLMNNAALGLGGPMLFALVSLLGVAYLLANLVTIAFLALVRFCVADGWIWCPSPAPSRQVAETSPEIALVGEARTLPEAVVVST
jgi:putative flippase GtrA